MHWRRKWQPTPVFLPRESQERGAWWASAYGVAQSQTRLKRLSSSSSSSKLILNVVGTKSFPYQNTPLKYFAVSEESTAVLCSLKVVFSEVSTYLLIYTISIGKYFIKTRVSSKGKLPIEFSFFSQLLLSRTE